VEVLLHALLTTALDEVNCSASRHSRVAFRQASR